MQARSCCIEADYDRMDEPNMENWDGSWVDDFARGLTAVVKVIVRADVNWENGTVDEDLFYLSAEVMVDAEEDYQEIEAVKIERDNLLNELLAKVAAFGLADKTTINTPR